MSHTVGIAQGHNTRGIVAFLPSAFGLAARACGCPREEKEPGDEIPPDLDARSSDA